MDKTVQKNEENAKEVRVTKSQKKDYIFAVGRRREAVARIRLYENVRDGLSWGEKEIKKGEVLVNKMLSSEYFPGDIMRHLYTEPMRVANTQNKYAITALVSGGGRSGQLRAMVHGISRALVRVNEEEYKDLLKKKGFLTRDDRSRERRMVGTGGKARRAKQSPKR